MKDKIKQIKEIIKDPKKKAILFFCFYSVFFLVIILLLRFGDRSITKSSDYEKGNSPTFDIQSILEDNYLYGYTITLDGVKYEYYGEKVGNTEYFEFAGKAYYKDGDKFFVKDNQWSECESPYVFSDFLDTEKLYSLLEKSYFESKTTYQSGKNNFNFLISTNTINQILSNIDSDFLEEPNQIVLIANNDKIINEVTLNLDSYCSLNNLCQKSLKINLQYDMFGEISSIENPVNKDMNGLVS